MSVFQAYYYNIINAILSYHWLTYRYEMEKLNSDNADVHVYHQHNQLKSELDSKKMLFSKNCIKISKVVGQGK